jgi:hypothetical protein
LGDGHEVLMRGFTLVGLLCAAILFAIIQIPVRFPGNPPEQGTLRMTPAIQAILGRACFDCHSNRTRWPWYTHIAPISWLAARDVDLGRRELNFSEWSSYLPVTCVHKLEWIGRVVGAQAMPPSLYRLFHPGSRLTPEDTLIVQRWVALQLDSLNHIHSKSESKQ